MGAYRFDVRTGRFVMAGAEKAPATAPAAAETVEKQQTKKKGRRPKNKAAQPADK